MPNNAYCPVCKKNYAGNDIAALVCGHTCHLDCIERWFEVSKSCPSCDREFPTEKRVIYQLHFDFKEEDGCFCSTLNLKEYYENECNIRKYQAKLDSLKHKLEDCKQTIEFLRKNVEDKDEELNNFKKYVTRCKKGWGEMENKLNRSKKMADAYKMELDIYKATWERIKKDVAKLNEKNVQESKKKLVTHMEQFTRNTPAENSPAEANAQRGRGKPSPDVSRANPKSDSNKPKKKNGVFRRVIKVVSPL